MGITLVEAELEHRHELQALAALEALAQEIITRIAPIYEVQSCSARMLDAINAALGPS